MADEKDKPPHRQFTPAEDERLEFHLNEVKGRPLVAATGEFVEQKNKVPVPPGTFEATDALVQELLRRAAERSGKGTSR